MLNDTNFSSAGDEVYNGNSLPLNADIFAIGVIISNLYVSHVPKANINIKDYIMTEGSTVYVPPNSILWWICVILLEYGDIIGRCIFDSDKRYTLKELEEAWDNL